MSQEKEREQASANFLIFFCAQLPNVSCSTNLNFIMTFSFVAKDIFVKLGFAIPFIVEYFGWAMKFAVCCSYKAGMPFVWGWNWSTSVNFRRKEEDRWAFARLEPSRKPNFLLTFWLCSKVSLNSTTAVNAFISFLYYDDQSYQPLCHFGCVAVLRQCRLFRSSQWEETTSGGFPTRLTVVEASQAP